MKLNTLEQSKAKVLGEIGTKNRDQYEQDLKMELLALKLKELRKLHNISQTELGQKIGVNHAWISKLENKKTDTVKLNTIIKVFKSLGASIKFEIVYDENTTRLLEKKTNELSLS